MRERGYDSDLSTFSLTAQFKKSSKIVSLEIAKSQFFNFQSFANFLCLDKNQILMICRSSMEHHKIKNYGNKSFSKLHLRLKMSLSEKELPIVKSINFKSSPKSMKNHLSMIRDIPNKVNRRKISCKVLKKQIKEILTQLKLYKIN